MMPRLILHIDMDAFFASVEQLDNPEYRGKPVVVGADPKAGRGRGVVCAASYEARRFGIRSAMPISIAFRKCPEAVFIRPRIERYREISQNIFTRLSNISPVMEKLSVDEAFLDLSEYRMCPEYIGLSIKKLTLRSTGLSSSIGIGSNKSVAKISSDMDKPNGLTICPQGFEKEFLAPLPVEKLWGVGAKGKMKLAKYNIKTIGDITRFTLEFFQNRMGKWGSYIWFLANGQDDREVTTNRKRKSIARETTFSEDRSDISFILSTLRNITSDLSNQLYGKKIQTKTITLKIRLSNFKTFTRSKTLNKPVYAPENIFPIIHDLLLEFIQPNMIFRLVGVSLSSLSGLNILEPVKANAQKASSGKNLEFSFER